MKTKLIYVLLIAGLVSRAQEATDVDTVHRNEISVSFLPIMAVFAGYSTEGSFVNYNFSYKRYLKNNYVMRTALVVFPPRQINPFQSTFVFHKSYDSVNVFKTQYAKANTRLQLNFGFEKLFRLRRLYHGYGAEIFGYQSVIEYKDVYQWFPTQVDPNSSAALQTYTADKMWTDRIYNKVDSMSSSYQRVSEGFGVHLFYSLRVRLNSRFYVSSTFGPYLSTSFVHFRNSEGNIPSWARGRQVNFDATILISDLSLAYRF